MQAGQLTEKVLKLEAKLTTMQQQHEQLSISIGQEQRKIRFFFGHDLDQLNQKDLEELEAFHRRGLSAVQNRLVSSGALTYSQSLSRAMTGADHVVGLAPCGLIWTVLHVKKKQ